jgi:flagellar motor switch protein FliN
MIKEAQPEYLASMSAAQAIAQLHRASQDVLAGVADRKLTVGLVSRDTAPIGDLSTVELNVLIEIQFEHPKDVLHSVVLLADAQELSDLFALGTPDAGEILAADALLRLGDVISSFVDTLAADLPWFQPAPRAWLANLDPIAPDPAGQLHCDLPPTLAAEETLFSLRLEVTTDSGEVFHMQAIIGETGEQALLGVGAEDTAAPPSSSQSMQQAQPAYVAPAPAPASSPTDVPKQEQRAAAAPRGSQQPPASVQSVQFQQLGPDQPAGRGSNIDLIRDVQLRVSVELGHATLSVREVLALGNGSVVELDRLAGEPVDVLVNDQLIARGEVVIVDESFGVRISEIVRGRA